MVIHWECTVCKAFWGRLKGGQPALSTEAGKAEETAHAAELKAIRETRAAEEEREAELATLRDNIMLRWFASDEYRKAERHNKRHQKKSKHGISRHEHRNIDRRH